MELSYCPDSNKKRSKFSECINIIEFLELSRIPYRNEIPAVMAGGVFINGNIEKPEGIVYLRYEFSDVIDFNDSKTKFEASPYVMGFTSADLSQRQIDKVTGEVLDSNDLFVINLIVQCDISKAGYLNYDDYYKTKLFPLCAKTFINISLPDPEICECFNVLKYVYDLGVYINYSHRLIDTTPIVHDEETVKLTSIQKEQISLLDSICIHLTRQALPICEEDNDLETVACVLFANFEYSLALQYLDKLLSYSNRVGKIDIQAVLAGAVEKINNSKNPKKKYDFNKLLDLAKLANWKKPINKELKSIVVRNSKGDHTIGLPEFRKYLELNGFCTYLHNQELTFVNHLNNVCTKVSKDEIQNFFNQQVEESESPLLDTLWSSHTKRLMDKENLKNLKNIGEIGIPSSKGIAYFPFENIVVKVTGKSMDEVNYTQLPFKIWDTDKIKKKFKGWNSKFERCDFAKFISNVSGGGAFKECFDGAIGYLCNGHKDSAITKVIMLTDFAIARTKEEANGGTGKSIFITAIKNIMPSVQLPNLDKNKNFQFQSVKSNHKIAFFGDAPLGFQFDILFDMITNDMITEAKNKTAEVIPFERSPKFIIATNHVIASINPSTKRRMYTLEFKDYYSDRFSPKDEFGKLLFDGWNDDEWNDFFCYMLNCVVKYMQKGLPELKAQNANIRQLIDCTCEEFYEFTKEFETSIEYGTNDIFDEFNRKFPEISESYKNGLSKMLFGKWVKRLCAINGWELKKIEKQSVKCYLFENKK